MTSVGIDRGRVLQGVRDWFGYCEGRDGHAGRREHVRPVRCVRGLRESVRTYVRVSRAARIGVRPDGFRQVDALRDAVRICS